MDKYQIVKACLNSFIDRKGIVPKFDYSDIEELAFRHRISPVVKYVCSIENSIDRNKTKNRHYQRIYNLCNVFNKLDKKSIPYAVIKGAYLDKIAYKNLGLRSSKDIDILIDKKNYTILCEILEAEGFVCGYYDEEKDEIKKYSRDLILYNYLYTHQAATYVKRVKVDGAWYTIKVDINFSVTWGEDTDGYRNSAEILNNLRYVEYEGIRYKVLTPEYFLLQLCLHSFRDMNSIVLIYKNKYSLRLLCDVYYYIVNDLETVNADKFVDVVKQLGYEKSIYHILYYVREVFGDNNWVTYVMDTLGENSKKWVSLFGLTDEERKVWNINFLERILCDDLFEKIKPMLTDSDINKVNSIMNNM